MSSTRLDTKRGADPDNIPAGLPKPGVTRPLSPPDNPIPPFLQVTQRLPVTASTAFEPMDNLSETQSLDRLATARMPVVTKRARLLTARRMPVVIPGAGKKLLKKVAPTPLKMKHRVVLHSLVVFVLLMIVSTTVASALSLGQNGKPFGVGGFLQRLGVINQVNSDSGNTAQSSNWQDNDTSGDHFPAGQCTWWASFRYHQLTGYWVDFSGNAFQWAYAAAATPGWVTSDKPHVPSIVVLQRGVQYANWTFGHVAILESMNADGTINTSGMNDIRYPPGAVSHENYQVGPGVSFVYHEGT